MYRYLSTFLLLAIGPMLLQCQGESKSVEPKSSLPEQRTLAQLTQQESSLLESTNGFGLSLFREIADLADNTENVFISPLSVSYNLGLCYNGASGSTREAIGSTLELAGLSTDELNAAYRDITQILSAADPLVDFSTANSFWSRQGKGIQPQFIDVARKYFEGRVEEIDLQAPWAADTINGWVKRATNDKITEMVTPPIDPSTVAMLMNAIYFNGSWMFPFDTAKTRVDTFHLADGSVAECQMMRLEEDDHAIEHPSMAGFLIPDTNATCYVNAYLKAVSLPYGAGDYRMTIILPGGYFNPGVTIDDVIDSLTLENWSDWVDQLRPDKFYISLPRFRFGCETALNDVLTALGMGIAFDPGQADFGNLFSDGVGWIDEVKQKAFIQVDERGTEAAAVTQTIFQDALPPDLVCDRPFLLVIHEDVSGAILFLGKIANPVWEE